MKQLLILSGKGGTGKTTIASAFIRLARAEAFADCDVDAPNLHLVTNWDAKPEKEPYYGLAKAQIREDVCVNCGSCAYHCQFHAVGKKQGKYQINPFACEGCGVCGYVCPAEAITMQEALAGEMQLYRQDGRVFSTAQLRMGSGNSGKLVTQVKKKMRRMGKNAELAIIDGSPGIGCPVIASLNGVDLALVVAEPSISGIHDLERILHTAEIFQVLTIVCVNKYDTNTEQTKKIEEYCYRRDVPFVGKIPLDQEAIRVVNAGKVIVDVECKAGEAVREIYKNTMEIIRVL